MATRRRYIRKWWLDDVRTDELGRAEIHFGTGKETFVLVMDGDSDFYSYMQAARDVHRKWLKDVMRIQNMLAPEISATVQERGD